MRPDIAMQRTVPRALPLASVKIGPAEVLDTFIPKLNGGINHATSPTSSVGSVLTDRSMNVWSSAAAD